jgi:hypothetical protein
MTGIGEGDSEPGGLANNTNDNIGITVGDIKQHGPVDTALVNLGGVVNISGSVYIGTSQWGSRVCCSPD